MVVPVPFTRSAEAEPFSVPPTPWGPRGQQAFDLVMDFLLKDQDMATLRSCALVNQASVPRARYLLFRRGHANIRLQDYGAHKLDHSPINFYFFTAIQGPSPRVMSMEDGLMISNLLTSVRIGGHFKDGKARLTGIGLSMIDLLATLPRLRVLRLCGLDVRLDGPVEALAVRPGSNVALSGLALQDVGVRVTTDCISFVLAVQLIASRFASIGTLCIGSIGSKNVEPQLTHDVGPFHGREDHDLHWHTPVTTLDLFNVPVGPYLDMMTRNSQAFATQSLVTCGGNVGDIEALQAYLQRDVVKASLQGLEIDFRNADAQMLATHNFNLMRLSTVFDMNTLTLKFPVRGNFGAMATASLAILQNAPKTISELDLGFAFERVPDTPDTDSDVLRHIEIVLYQGFIGSLQGLMVDSGFGFINAIRISLLLDTQSALVAIKRRWGLGGKMSPFEALRGHVMALVEQYSRRQQFSTALIQANVQFADLGGLA